MDAETRELALSEYVHGLKSEKSLNALLAWLESIPDVPSPGEPFDPLKEDDWKRLRALMEENRQERTSEVTARVENGELRLHQAEGITVRGNEVIWPDGHRLIIKLEPQPA
jgi:hypothetical protein